MWQINFEKYHVVRYLVSFIFLIVFIGLATIYELYKKNNTTELNWICENQTPIRTVEWPLKNPEKILKQHQRFIDVGDTQLKLYVNGTLVEKTLWYVHSGSGNKYSGNVYTFWSKNKTAYIMKDNKIIIRDCRFVQ